MHCNVPVMGLQIFVLDNTPSQLDGLKAKIKGCNLNRGCNKWLFFNHAYSCFGSSIGVHLTLTGSDNPTHGLQGSPSDVVLRQTHTGSTGSTL